MTGKLQTKLKLQMDLLLDIGFVLLRPKGLQRSSQLSSEGAFLVRFAAPTCRVKVEQHADDLNVGHRP